MRPRSSPRRWELQPGKVGFTAACLRACPGRLQLGEQNLKKKTRNAVLLIIACLWLQRWAALIELLSSRKSSWSRWHLSNPPDSNPLKVLPNTVGSVPNVSSHPGTRTRPVIWTEKQANLLLCDVPSVPNPPCMSVGCCCCSSLNKLSHQISEDSSLVAHFTHLVKSRRKLQLN